MRNHGIEFLQEVSASLITILLMDTVNKKMVEGDETISVKIVCKSCVLMQKMSMKVEIRCDDAFIVA